MTVTDTEGGAKPCQGPCGSLPVPRRMEPTHIGTVSSRSNVTAKELIRGSCVVRVVVVVIDIFFFSVVLGLH